MKKLFYIIVIIGIPVIIFFQFQNWRKFSPPNQYDYQLSDKIDIDYFDPDAVKTYYQNAQEIGSFARATWHTYGIDVRNFDQTDEQSVSKAAYYNLLVSQTKQLEKQLEMSQSYKSDGYSNAEIRQIITTGIKPEDLKRQQKMQQLFDLQFGDLSQEVYILQKILSEKGYTTPVDGNFRSSTRETLQQFQTDNNLAPTGRTDKQTLESLLK
ncbi:MAG: peptidoglycan-binding domain-containing protein [Bacteroidota bacterium]